MFCRDSPLPEQLRAGSLWLAKKPERCGIVELYLPPSGPRPPKVEAGEPLRKSERKWHRTMPLYLSHSWKWEPSSTFAFASLKKRRVPGRMLCGLLPAQPRKHPCLPSPCLTSCRRHVSPWQSGHTSSTFINQSLFSLMPCLAFSSLEHVFPGKNGGGGQGHTY